MDLRDRIWLGNIENERFENGLNLAVANGFHYADVCVDGEFPGFGAERARAIRKMRDEYGSTRFPP